MSCISKVLNTQFKLRHHLVLVIVLGALAACGGGSGGDSNLSNSQPQTQPPEVAAAAQGNMPNPQPQTNPGSVTYSGSGVVGTSGGMIVSGDATIEVPEGAVLKDISIVVSEIDLPEDLPSGLRLLGDVADVDISASDQESINAPFKITLGYDDTGVSDENDIIPFHFNGDSYEPVRLISQDVDANTITFESRDFSPFVLGLIGTILPSNYDTGFTAPANGWDINNFGSYFAPGGNCLGMAGYATWFYNNRSESLSGRYSADVARLISIRTHLAQSQTWAVAQWRIEQKLSDEKLGRILKAYISLVGQPLIFLMGRNGSPAHATVVYGYDASGFKFYDVNAVGQSQTVSYNGTSFGTYGSYNSFGYVAVASLGRTEDFAALTAEAESGFTTSDDITLNTPLEGEEIASREATLSGGLSGALNSATKLWVEIKGIGREIPVTNGNFNSTIEVSSGENTMVLLAGVDIRNQSNYYKNGATLIRSVEGVLADSRLLVTLTWNQNDTDVDLYITEPSGETIWFADKVTSNGLALDFDDTTGYGPEHGTLEVASSSTVLEGLYRVRVHYYSDYGTGVAVSGSVSIVINEGTENQKVATIPFQISVDGGNAYGPNGTGASWVDIATVDIINGVINVN